MTMRAILLATFALSGCAAMSDPNSPWYLAPTSPDQQCRNAGGQWSEIRTYDASGNSAAPTFQCVTAAK